MTKRPYDDPPGDDRIMALADTLQALADDLRTDGTRVFLLTDDWANTIRVGMAGTRQQKNSVNDPTGNAAASNAKAEMEGVNTSGVGLWHVRMRQLCSLLDDNAQDLRGLIYKATKLEKSVDPKRLPGKGPCLRCGKDCPGGDKRRRKGLCSKCDSAHYRQGRPDRSTFIHSYHREHRPGVCDCESEKP